VQPFRAPLHWWQWITILLHNLVLAVLIGVIISWFCLGKRQTYRAKNMLMLMA
jgi:MFS superfamily sulfate permease-like transporter